MKRYNPSEIEPKWQSNWEESKLYHVTEDPNREKTYVIAMFPYPSGAGLHVGHVRNYSITDTIARYHRQRGRNTLSTIGWDAFGLPAENYAIKTGTPPAISTHQNIDTFKSQLKRLGMSYDWSREVSTDDPKYYKWTQWIFAELFKRDLAYQKESPQWWCETDKTVLANEQVEGGKCWRCGNPPVKKNLKQWFFKITNYADQLLEGVEDLGWPERIKAMQRNWIGRSQGAEIDFAVEGGEPIKVFTTRPDTIFGATFLVLAPEHPMVEKLTKDEQKNSVEAYIKATQAKSDIERMNTDREKTGVFSGAYATNPANNQQIPIWVADYVLTGYGTGAIMAVPAHDDRDHEFANKFDLPIIDVVEPVTGKPQHDPEFRRSIVAIVRDPATDKYVSINWGDQGGNLFVGGGREEAEDVVETAKREIAEETGYTNIKLVSQTGNIHHNYFAASKNVPRRIEAQGLLFDLIDSTQQAQKLEVNEQGKFTVQWLQSAEVENKIKDELHATVYQLLIKGECYHGEGLLVNSTGYDGMPTSEARDKIIADLAQKGVATEKINYRIRDWLVSRQRYWGAPIPIIHCPEHGAVPVPEKDLPVVLPEVESYQPTGVGTSVLAGVEDWVNVPCPTCGKPAKRETDTMDGYACSSWYYLRYLDPTNDEQPWDKEKADYWMPIDFYCGGDHAVSHLLYSRFWMHVFADVGLISKTRVEPVKKLVYNGYINAHDGTKMSKSKGNVVNPNELIDQGYGADALRLYELFIAPYELDAAWDPKGITGTYRFLSRYWTLVQEIQDSDDASGDKDADVHRAISQTAKRVTRDLEKQSFNTAIAALMEGLNSLYKLRGQASKDTWFTAMRAFTQLLAPFAPHITEEVWQQLDGEGSVHVSGWPTWDDSALAQATTTIIVQVDGKVRAKLTVATDTSQADIEAAALADEHVQKFVENKKPARVIHVPGKLVNIVV